MVRAWMADVTPLLEENCYRQIYERLPLFRREKADALRRPEAKAQSVGAWTLWEKIRAEYGLPESSVYNLSHSGKCVMCAAELGDVPGVRVGCDVEQVREARLRVAAHFFCEEEYRTIAGGETEEERQDRFYRYWVLKESFMKATRRGMAMPLDGFSVRLGNPPELIKQPADFPEKYYYREFRCPGLPYRMAVCTTDEVIDSEIHTELGLL